MKVHLRYWKLLAIALVFASATLYSASGYALPSILISQETSDDSSDEPPPPDNKRKPRGGFSA
ncbi:MAG: hypothetical protein F6J93_13345 [Oscillatoria sp. SIO1A7]|nr:hypothetical protein [Oscillatoria sp. SIO1A7]